ILGLVFIQEHAVVLSDTELQIYAFKTIPGFEHIYVWSARGPHEADPAEVDACLPRSALPPAGGSLLQLVTFPPAATSSRSAADQKAIAEGYRARLLGLAESLERDGSGMHATPRIDYALVLDGELWLELDDGETVHLHAGDIS